MKVAILGKLDTKFNAPFDDPTWEIWSMNIHKQKLPRVDVWFDIHANKPNPNATIKRQDYPFAEVESMVGGNYFNNSVSYMIAYAVLKGYKEIALYGMRFEDDHEKRTKQYQNVREMIFFAKGRGVIVTAPSDSVMLKEYPKYGA